MILRQSSYVVAGYGHVYVAFPSSLQIHFQTLPSLALAVVLVVALVEPVSLDAVAVAVPVSLKLAK